MLEKERKKSKKKDSERIVESGKVKMDEAEKRLEFEGTLRPTSTRFFSRIVLRHVVLRATSRTTKKEKGKT